MDNTGEQEVEGGVSLPVPHHEVAMLQFPPEFTLKILLRHKLSKGTNGQVFTPQIRNRFLHLCENVDGKPGCTKP